MLVILVSLWFDLVVACFGRWFVGLLALLLRVEFGLVRFVILIGLGVCWFTGWLVVLGLSCCLLISGFFCFVGDLVGVWFAGCCCLVCWVVGVCEVGCVALLVVVILVCLLVYCLRGS